MDFPYKTFIPSANLLALTGSIIIAKYKFSYNLFFMDVLFIPTRYKVKELRNIENLLEKIPKEVGIVCTIQYMDFFIEIERILKEKGYVVHKKYPYYVLGCFSEAANLPVSDIILIGNGKFHALEIVRKHKKRVFVYDPISGSINLYDKFNYSKILYLLEELKKSTTVGIILSIKPGQYNYSRLNILIEKLRDKKVYLFIGDKIDLNSLINFPYIDFWIIDACPRILDDILENNIKALTAEIILDEGSTNQR